MKKSELKEMIRKAMMEDTESEKPGSSPSNPKFTMKPDSSPSNPKFTMKPEELGLEEAEEEVEIEDKVDVEVEDEVEISDPGEIDVEADAQVGITGDAKKVQDNLEAALIAAKELGDSKLVDQIGNSITFFTRTHVVGSEEISADNTLGEINIDLEDETEGVGIGLEEENITESYERKRMLKIAGIKK
jgi:hypothetical protein